MDEQRHDHLADALLTRLLVLAPKRLTSDCVLTAEEEPASPRRAIWRCIVSEALLAEIKPVLAKGIWVLGTPMAMRLRGTRRAAPPEVTGTRFECQYDRYRVEMTSFINMPTITYFVPQPTGSIEAWKDFDTFAAHMASVLSSFGTSVEAAIYDIVASGPFVKVQLVSSATLPLLLAHPVIAVDGFNVICTDVFAKPHDFFFNRL